MAGGHDMGLIHLSPPEAKKIVLCRPIIHDFSLKMASPRLPMRAPRVHISVHMRRLQLYPHRHKSVHITARKCWRR